MEQGTKERSLVSKVMDGLVTGIVEDKYGAVLPPQDVPPGLTSSSQSPLPSRPDAPEGRSTRQSPAPSFRQPMPEVPAARLSSREFAVTTGGMTNLPRWRHSCFTLWTTVREAA